MSGGYGGGSGGAGCKLYVKAAAGLVQLAGGFGGYAWDGLSYDDAAYRHVYGADPQTVFDPLAVVFKVPADGRYRVSALIWPVGAAGAVGGVIRAAGDGLTAASDLLVTAAYTAGVHDTAAFTTYGPTLFVWEGRITAADDGSLVGLWTALAIAPADNIAQGSWLAIKQIG